MSTLPIIELRDVSQIYVSKTGAKRAIDRISFTVHPGEFVSIVGPSGCGKTTLLSSIAGLLQPTAGSIIVDGQQILQPSANVGYMLQSNYLFDWKTIKENTLIGLKVMGKYSQESDKYANYLLQEMGLSAYKDHYPAQLSGGMRQRAALVRTLVTNPKILLLDEPFSALDYQTRLKLEDLVFQTLKKHEKTAILVTHDIAESIAMSDRVIILDREPGRIKNVVHIPPRIRGKLPLEAREVEGFHDLFRMIWRELESDETGS
jgi:NitT/TauT family transport system ATP-binding protein